jgi:acyl dehydratase
MKENIMNIGAVFHSTIPAVTQAQINCFGELHGTNGRTHTDPEYANASAFGGVIVQGALIMAPIFDICRCIVGAGADVHMEVETKFVAFSRPGELILVRVEVVAFTSDQIDLSYTCSTTEGKTVQVGTVFFQQ